MTEEEKIAAGVLFCPGDPSLRAIKRQAHRLNQDFNKLYEDDAEERLAILKSLVAGVGDGAFLHGPIYFHYGQHTRIGVKFFANFNLTIQDDASVTIGDFCSFGPNVTIVTPIHPLIAEERRQMRTADGGQKALCYAKPVVIGNDCWLGANVTVCPGVTIGDGCVIGAGSVVTRSIPARSFAAGVPCQVIRPITDADSMVHKPEILADNQVI